ASQSGAVTPVLRMSDHPEPRPVSLLQPDERLAGAVAAAIVDHNHFKIGRALAQYSEGLLNQCADGRRVVVGGKEDAEAVSVRHARSAVEDLSPYRRILRPWRRYPGLFRRRADLF